MQPNLALVCYSSLSLLVYVLVGVAVVGSVQVDSDLSEV